MRKIGENLILRTACAFAIAFSIPRGVVSFTAAFMHYDPYQVYAVLMVGTIFYAVMGGLALLAIRVKLQSNQWGLSSFLQASSVCGLAFFIPTALIHWSEINFTLQSVAIANTLRSAFMGACIGGLLGSYERNWRLLIWLTIVGAIGFSIQGLMTQSPDTYLNRWGFLAINFGFPIMSLVSFSIRGAITGMVGGALMGWILRKHKENQLYIHSKNE